MKIYHDKKKMFMLVFSMSILMVVASVSSSVLATTTIQNSGFIDKENKFTRNVSQEQVGSESINVAFVISAWQYYSRSIITSINQSLARLTNNASDFNFSIIVVEGNTTRNVLENLLNLTRSIVQDATFDHVVFFVSPWEDTQLRYELSQLWNENKIKTNIVFFDSMRPNNAREYLSYYGFADEELAFIAGSVSAYVASKMADGVDEIAFYTNLPDLGPPNPKQGYIPEWHDFVTDVSVTGFIQGVLYYNQQLDVTSVPLFDDLNQISDIGFINQIARNIVNKMESGELRVVAIRAPYNLTNAIVSLLSSRDNDSMLVVLDHDVTLSQAVSFSIPKNHTFLLEKMLDAIKNDKMERIMRYSYKEGAYSVKHVKGTLPTDLEEIIDQIAVDYFKGNLIIPVVITTATIQPFDVSATILVIFFIPIVIWFKRRRKAGEG